MTGITFKAKVISMQSELPIKLEEQTHTYESRVRDLIGLRWPNCAQYADIKSGFSEQPFAECIKKIKATTEGFKRREP
jgi:hypothetical protein